MGYSPWVYLRKLERTAKISTRTPCNVYCHRFRNQYDKYAREKNGSYIIECMKNHEHDKETKPLTGFIHCLDMCHFCYMDGKRFCGQPEKNPETFYKRLADTDFNLDTFGANISQNYTWRCPATAEKTPAVVAGVLLLLWGMLVSLYVIFTFTELLVHCKQLKEIKESMTDNDRLSTKSVSSATRSNQDSQHSLPKSKKSTFRRKLSKVSDDSKPTPSSEPGLGQIAERDAYKRQKKVVVKKAILFALTLFISLALLVAIILYLVFDEKRIDVDAAHEWKLARKMVKKGCWEKKKECYKGQKFMNESGM